MSEKRRDNRNRILRNGESQRKDGRYAFKYIDATGKPQFVYSWKLEKTDKLPTGKRDDLSLREKEKLIQKDIDDQIVPRGGEMTVEELVRKYLMQKTGVRHNTEANYNFVLNIIKKEEFGNSTLTIVQRKGIAQQILRAFDYLHSKGHLHRDISPKNILIKEYDDTLVVKLSDFGLVKIPDSTLTTVNTEFKGYFNDPALVVEGFNTYGIVHETYALTRVIYFVMTGKTNTEKITNQNLRAFVEKGLNPDKIKRFQNIRDMISAFKAI